MASPLSFSRRQSVLLAGLSLMTCLRSLFVVKETFQFKQKAAFPDFFRGCLLLVATLSLQVRFIFL